MSLAITKPKRVKSRTYREFIHELQCVACACEGKETFGVDPAHVSFLAQKGFGSKVSDILCLPLCRAHHDEQHSLQQEAIFWARLGINAKSLTKALADAAPDVSAAIEIIWAYARGSRGVHRLRPAGELFEPVEVAPPRVTITAHLSEQRDANGNQGVILPTLGNRGETTTIAFVDPNAVSPTPEKAANHG